MSWPDEHQIVKTVACYRPDWVLPEGVGARCTISQLVLALQRPDITQSEFSALLCTPTKANQERVDEPEAKPEPKPARYETPASLGRRYAAYLVWYQRAVQNHVAECIESLASSGLISTGTCTGCSPKGYHLSKRDCSKCIRKVMDRLAKDIHAEEDLWTVEHKTEYRRMFTEERMEEIRNLSIHQLAAMSNGQGDYPREYHTLTQ